MDRLTFEGNFCDISRCQNTPGGSFCEDGACSQRKVWERLKEYEDAGLSPQACVEAREIEAGLSTEDYSIHRMVELMRADKDGRLAVLPCKDWLDIVFGEQVLFWGIDGNRVVEISVDDADRITWYIGWKSVTIKGIDECGDDWEFNARDIGETVFLTREEAEKALEGRK